LIIGHCQICIPRRDSVSPRLVGGPPSDPRSDDQLIADINAGDASAFDSLYWRYRDWVVGLAYRFTGDSDDALDVLQETFAYLVGKFPEFKLTASMKTFLYPAVRNLSIEICRKRRRDVANDLDFDLLPAPVAPSDDRADLATMLADLPQTHREVLLMRFVDGLSMDEIAAALRIPSGTVKSRLHNALERLRADPRTRRYFQI
jgi:RNA polymerase sigma-70 factor, ECF subfamily